MRGVLAENGLLVVRELADPEPSRGEVLIKVHATALNRADLLQARGAYDPPPGATRVLGLECAGEVVAVGPGVQQRRVGDRVCALLSGGGNATLVSVDERCTMAVPAAQSWQEAAAVPEVWLTAFQLLHLVARVRKEDVLLVHAGASGVGTAAIQLARAAGLQHVLVTTGSQDKVDFCIRLGASQGFNYKEARPWAEQVLAATGGRGVDVVLDCVGYTYAEGNARVLAMDGRWVVFGMLGGPAPKDAPALLGPILGKRLQVLGTTLRSRSADYKADLVAQFQLVTGPLFAAGALRPVLDKVQFFGLDAIQDAHTYMASDQSMGKIILSVL